MGLRILPFLLALVCVFSVTANAGDGRRSIHNKNIELADYLKVEGTYDLKTTYHFLDDQDQLRSEPFPVFDLFVLLYDASHNKLIGAFTSTETHSPLVVFHDLQTSYNDDKTSLVVTGLGGGTLYGELKLNIEIEAAGKISGTFVDGHLTGRKELNGKRKSSLLSFLWTGEATTTFVAPERYSVDDIVGEYEGTQKGGSGNCGAAQLKDCHFRIILRRFSDGTLTAALSFRTGEGRGGPHDGYGPKIAYSGGQFDEHYGLVEFTSPGRPMNPRLRSKLNVKMLPDRRLCVYIYGTNGQHLYYKAQWHRKVLD